MREAYVFRAITGMDDFAKAASDAWIILTELVAQIPIDRNEKRRLQSAIESANLYLKSTYKMRCSDDSECQSHCTIFALSEPDKSSFFQTCSHEHKSICEGKMALSVFSVALQL